jgi:hypothetical protein
MADLNNRRHRPAILSSTGPNITVVFLIDL